MNNENSNPNKGVAKKEKKKKACFLTIVLAWIVTGDVRFSGEIGRVGLAFRSHNLATVRSCPYSHVISTAASRLFASNE